jgi:hypothetical protein
VRVWRFTLLAVLQHAICTALSSAAEACMHADANSSGDAGAMLGQCLRHRIRTGAIRTLRRCMGRADSPSNWAAVRALRLRVDPRLMAAKCCCMVLQ